MDKPSLSVEGVGGLKAGFNAKSLLKTRTGVAGRNSEGGAGLIYHQLHLLMMQDYCFLHTRNNSDDSFLWALQINLILLSHLNVIQYGDFQMPKKRLA